MSAREKFLAAYHDRRLWVRTFHTQGPMHAPADDPLHEAMTMHPLPYWQAAFRARKTASDPLRFPAWIRLACRKARCRMNTEDFTAYEGKEAVWRGQWVMIEVADEAGCEVTDQYGGNHSVGWGELDVVASAA